MRALEVTEQLVKKDQLRRIYIAQYYFTLDTTENRQYFFECDDSMRFIVETLVKNYGLRKAEQQPLGGIIYTRDYHLER